MAKNIGTANNGLPADELHALGVFHDGKGWRYRFAGPGWSSDEPAQVSQRRFVTQTECVRAAIRDRVPHNHNKHEGANGAAE